MYFIDKSAIGYAIGWLHKDTLKTAAPPGCPLIADDRASRETGSAHYHLE
jgi:hypothetical protein